MKELHIPGVETSINIKSLNGNQKISSTLADGIMVSKQVMSANNPVHWIKIPKVYSKKAMPADPSEVATPFKLKKRQ